MKVQSHESAQRRVATAPDHYRGTVEGDDGYPARFAAVYGALRPEVVARYLPDNYALMESFPSEDGLVVVIGGTDAAGWTLDGYVIPRLLSGNFGAKEIGA